MSLENNHLNSETPSSRRAFGSRRLTLDSQRYRIDSERFDGLPKGISAPHALLALVKASAPALGLHGTDQRMIDKLFQYTRPIDWTPPSRPIVSVSNEVLAEDLSLSRSAVQRALRRLQEHGLIVMKDSPTGQRYFRRDPETKAIMPARSFGIDLSILAVRHSELGVLAARHDAEKRQRRDAKRRAIIAWRCLAQLAETASEEGLWTSAWDGLMGRAEALHILIPRLRSLAERQHVAGALENLREEARAMLETAFAAAANQGDKARHTRPMGSADAPLKNDTEGSNNWNPVSARQIEGWRSGARPLNPERQESLEGTGAPEQEMRVHISPEEIVRLVPELRAGTGPAPDWARLGEACEQLRADYEIGHRLWERARLALGGAQKRIIAFADMLTYPDAHFTKTRGAYFAGMVQKAEAGRLNLGSSVYGMRQRAAIHSRASFTPRLSKARAASQSTIHVSSALGAAARRLGAAAAGEEGSGRGRP